MTSILIIVAYAVLTPFAVIGGVAAMALALSDPVPAALTMSGVMAATGAGLVGLWLVRRYLQRRPVAANSGGGAA